MFKKYSLVFLKGILAGLAIGLGGFLYIVVSTYTVKILGSIVFAVGLFLVCFFALQLYTGKIGNLFDEKPKYLIDLGVMLIGNTIGAYAFGWLMRGTNILAVSEIADKINSVCLARLVGVGEETWYRALYLSICCGMLVFFAVWFYKNIKIFPLKIVALVACVAAFVYFGFEHVIANIFYFGFGAVFSASAVVNVLICLVGNSLGAFAARAFVYLVKKVG